MYLELGHNFLAVRAPVKHFYTCFSFNTASTINNNKCIQENNKLQKNPNTAVDMMLTITANYMKRYVKRLQHYTHRCSTTIALHLTCVSVK